MSNIAKALKAEISRIGRKEAKSAISPIARSNIALKKCRSEGKSYCT